MKRLLFSLIFLLSLQAFAQNEEIINDANVQKRTLSGSFNSISVTDGIELFLTQGNEEAIAISVSDNKYLERYKTEIDGNTLRIYYDNKGVNWTGNEKRKLKAYVSFKNLEKLHASGGANVKMKSPFKADNTEFTFTSGSRFSGEVNIDKMDIEQNSGSEIDITGKAGSIKVEVSSGAFFKGFELAVDYCDARASSGGGVRINVNKELNVKASSGGGIRYRGEGLIKDMNVSSGGNVKKG